MSEIQKYLRSGEHVGWVRPGKALVDGNRGLVVGDVYLFCTAEGLVTDTEPGDTALSRPRAPANPVYDKDPYKGRVDPGAMRRPQSFDAETTLNDILKGENERPLTATERESIRELYLRTHGPASPSGEAGEGGGADQPRIEPGGAADTHQVGEVLRDDRGAGQAPDDVHDGKERPPKAPDHEPAGGSTPARGEFGIDRDAGGRGDIARTAGIAEEHVGIRKDGKPYDKRTGGLLPRRIISGPGAGITVTEK